MKAGSGFASLRNPHAAQPAYPANEPARVATLRSLSILDTPAEERFDRLTRLAKRLFGVPITLVTLVDSEPQWFKSCVGLDVSETPRNVSFCGHAILSDELLLIDDARNDLRFHDNPHVTGCCAGNGDASPEQAAPARHAVCALSWVPKPR